MTAHRWLGPSLAIGITAIAFIACKTSISPGTGGHSGTGGAGGATTSASSGTTSTGPILCSNSYTNVPKGSCDLLQQNCPPGKTCEAATGTTVCVTSPGLKTAGEPCYDPDECNAKLICVGDMPGKCVAICCP